MNRIMGNAVEFMSEIAYLYDIICHPCTEERIMLYNDVFGTAFPQGPIRVLDMGCCTGQTALQVSSKQFAVTGIDLSPGMIEEAHSKANAMTTFQTMDMRDLQFEDSTFEVIYSNSLEWIDSFEHLESVVKESTRCLKPNGLLLFDFPLRERFIETCHLFYSECVEVEDGSVYKITKYETSDIGVDLRALQTYICLDYATTEQTNYTGWLQWRLHSQYELTDLAQKYDLRHTDTFYDYKAGTEGAFIQMVFRKGDD